MAGLVQVVMTLTLIHVPLHEVMATKLVMKLVMMVILKMMMGETLTEEDGTGLIAQLEQDLVHHLFELEFVEMDIMLIQRKAEMMVTQLMVMGDQAHANLKLDILDLVVVIMIQTPEQQYEQME